MHKSLIVLLIILSSFAQAKSAKDIVALSESLFRGRTSRGRMEMKIVTSRWERSIRMSSWNKGSKKSFIRVDYPKRDKGITFLKLNDEMWQYVPKIEKTIKIPPSMMMQSWMGSDFTNDDLVKESSISDDYNSKIVSQDKKSWSIKLTSKENAAVVWGKIIYIVNKNTYLPLEERFFDEHDKLIKVLYFKNVKKFNDRYYPTLWEMVPMTEDKKGNKTIIKVLSIKFNTPIKNTLFTRRNLKLMSR